MIHVTTLQLAEPDPDGKSEMLFVSLDGEDYLPVNRAPVPGDEEVIAELFDGDGNFKPMRFARRAMDPRWWPNEMVTEVVHSTVE